MQKHCWYKWKKTTSNSIQVQKSVQKQHAFFGAYDYIITSHMNLPLASARAPRVYNAVVLTSECTIPGLERWDTKATPPISLKMSTASSEMTEHFLKIFTFILLLLLLVVVAAGKTPSYYCYYYFNCSLIFKSDRVVQTSYMSKMIEQMSSSCRSIPLFSQIEWMASRACFCISGHFIWNLRQSSSSLRSVLKAASTTVTRDN